MLNYIVNTNNKNKLHIALIKKRGGAHSRVSKKFVGE